MTVIICDIDKRTVQLLS